MKIFFWATAIVVVGWAIGALVVLARLGIGTPEPDLAVYRSVEPSGACCHIDTRPISYEGQPRIVVEKSVHDFGVMSSEEKKKHDFVIRNGGKSPLKIEDGGTGCKCAIAKLEKKILDPGERSVVTLEWNAKGFFGPYQQVATLNTNDPRYPKVALTVRGRVTSPARANPAEVVFSNVTAGHAAHASVSVFCYKSKDFKVTEMEMLNSDTAEFFEVSTGPLPSEQLEREADALAGQEIEIAVKPGLPVGPFLQTILVRTNLPEAPRIEIPVKGKVGSDISIVGRDWDENRQMLRLGILSPGEGADRTLLLLVRGRHRHHVDFEVAEVSPAEIIQVKIEHELGDKKGIVTRVPLKIHIPKHSGPANYLGSKQSRTGHIILETTHPEIPRIKIPVSFAIEGG